MTDMPIKLNKKGYRVEWRNPATLEPNPLNHRRHPEHQKRVLRAALSEEGWIDPVIYNSRSKRLIDGHARAEEAIAQGIEEIPVLVVDLDEATEKRVLARHDKIGALADIDLDALGSLLDGQDDKPDLGWGELSALTQGGDVDGFFVDETAGKKKKTKQRPWARLDFPPRVWLSSRDEILERLREIKSEFGAEMDVSDEKQA